MPFEGAEPALDDLLADLARQEAFTTTTDPADLADATAVFIADPLVAIGAINEAHKMGVKIPEDLSIVGFDDTDGLCFIAGPSGCDPALLPEGDAPDGAVFEYAPQREALMQTLSARLAATGGAALFFDYGHLKPGTGDTLQAVRAHAYDGVFDHPGEADLTSHVDFSALACIARQAGLRITTLTQGEFLLGVGIKERAQNLGAKATPAIRARLAGEAERLSGETGMGKLFQVLAILVAVLTVIMLIAFDWRHALAFILGAACSAAAAWAGTN